MPRRSRADAAATRQAILDEAVRAASVDGLEGMTIGQLASQLHITKSGLIGHFGSKQSLQLEAFGAALESFRLHVWDAVADEEPGLQRLLALCDAWMAFYRRRLLPGGCFMTTVTVEFDARPGPLRDTVARASGVWLRMLADEVRVAREHGDLAADVDAVDTAFELHALAAATNVAFNLSGDEAALERGRRTMRRVLGVH